VENEWFKHEYPQGLLCLLFTKYVRNAIHTFQITSEVYVIYIVIVYEHLQAFLCLFIVYKIYEESHPHISNNNDVKKKELQFIFKIWKTVNMNVYIHFKDRQHGKRVRNQSTN
jgi:hypothetical protein